MYQEIILYRPHNLNDGKKSCLEYIIWIMKKREGRTNSPLTADATFGCPYLDNEKKYYVGYKLTSYGFCVKFLDPI